jgi:Asp-tRNA(Asn)/Glu-tRNA(Gln) amidotransferase A subunit family amidase
MPDKIGLELRFSAPVWPKTCATPGSMPRFEPMHHAELPIALPDLSARAARERMARGELTAADYAAALQQRTDEIAHLGAMLHTDARALAESAAALDRQPGERKKSLPLFGVPIAFKDNIDVAGLPTTAGSTYLQGHVPRRSAPVAERLIGAGALVLGKANLHEWSQGVTGHNHAYGPSRNPFEPSRITGGSSGGNAVVLGMRAAPIAIGTDTGGSVRVPAALCGLVGFRPSIGRWPAEGLVPISPTFDTAGVMARCVDDCVLVDAVVTGGPHWLAPKPVQGARLGIPASRFWESLDPPVAETAALCLERLREAGVVLVPCELNGAGPLFDEGAMSISLYEILPAISAYFARHGRPFDARALADAVVSPDVRPLFERLFGDGAITPEAYHHALLKLRPRMQRAYAKCFARYRLAALIFPTTPLAAARIGEDVEVMLCGQRVPAFSAYIRNTGPAGMAGLPAISLPMGLTKHGLPVGIELDGPGGSDRALLALALGIEGILPPAPAPPLPRRPMDTA